MKKLILIISLVGLCANFSYGQVYNYFGRIEQSIIDDTLNVDLFLVRAGIASGLVGDAVLEIFFNSTALSFIGKDGGSDGRWDDGNSTSYDDVFAYSIINIASMRIFYNNSGPALDVPPAPGARVGRFQFRILGKNALSNVRWNSSLCMVLDQYQLPVAVNWINPDDFTVPVELSSFQATASDGHILLHWVTQSENENLGYNIYRADSQDLQYQLLNETIIPGAGNSDVECRYEYRDHTVEIGKIYLYQLSDVSFNGAVQFHGPVKVMATQVSQFALAQNYPNPFNPTTLIPFQIEKAGFVSLTVYDVQGRKVKTLRSCHLSQGYHEIQWDGTDDAGNQVPSGSYLCVLNSNGQKDATKMQLVR
jgi:hypothetical protein